MCLDKLYDHVSSVQVEYESEPVYRHGSGRMAQRLPRPPRLGLRLLLTPSPWVLVDLRSLRLLPLRCWALLRRVTHLKQGQMRWSIGMPPERQIPITLISFGA